MCQIWMYNPCFSAELSLYLTADVFCPPIDSIITLMTVWRITGKIFRTTIIVNCICMHIMEFLQF